MVAQRAALVQVMLAKWCCRCDEFPHRLHSLHGFLCFLTGCILMIDGCIVTMILLRAHRHLRAHHEEIGQLAAKKSVAAPLAGGVSCNCRQSSAKAFQRRLIAVMLLRAEKDLKERAAN